MKRLGILVAGIAMLATTSGCCCWPGWHGAGYGGMCPPGGACPPGSTGAPQTYGPAGYQSPGPVSLAVPQSAPVGVPQTAAAPLQPLTTY